MLSASRDCDRPRFLPASIEDRLIGCCGRASGCPYSHRRRLAVGQRAVVVARRPEPHACDRRRGTQPASAGRRRRCRPPSRDARLATLALLMAPMFWGLELVVSERVRFRAKAAFSPLSVILLAGALSALPIAPGLAAPERLRRHSRRRHPRLRRQGIFGLINPERAVVAARAPVLRHRNCRARQRARDQAQGLSRSAASGIRPASRR